MGNPLTRRTNVGYWLLFGVAIVAVGAVACLKSLRTPIQPVPRNPYGCTDISGLIRVHADQANHRDRDALQAFEMSTDRILTEHKEKLRRAARLAAKEASGYVACCKLVACLAWDKVRRQNTAERYLNGAIKPFIAPAVRDLSAQMDSAMARLDHDLRASTVLMARDLAAVAPGDCGRDLAVGVATVNHPDAPRALRNLGLDAAGIAVFGGFDVMAFSSSRLARGLWRGVAPIAGRVFGRQVATTAAAMTGTFVDGPLPIGDMLAVGGMLWTAYDIHSSRKRFAKEIEAALRNLVDETTGALHARAIRQATEMVKRHRGFQDSMGSRTLEATTGRRN